MLRSHVTCSPILRCVGLCETTISGRLHYSIGGACGQFRLEIQHDFANFGDRKKHMHLWILQESCNSLNYFLINFERDMREISNPEVTRWSWHSLKPGWLQGQPRNKFLFQPHGCSAFSLFISSSAKGRVEHHKGGKHGFGLVLDMIIDYSSEEPTTKSNGLFDLDWNRFVGISG